jgi:HJR/Mrr/RecB family endonuclease
MNARHIGNNIVEYKCPDCGAVWDHSYVDVEHAYKSRDVTINCPLCSTDFETSISEISADHVRVSDEDREFELHFGNICNETPYFLKPLIHAVTVKFPNYKPRMDRKQKLNDLKLGSPREAAVTYVIKQIRSQGYRITGGSPSCDIAFLANVIKWIPDNHLKVLETKKNLCYKNDVYGFSSFAVEQFNQESEGYSGKYVANLLTDGCSAGCVNPEIINIVKEIYPCYTGRWHYPLKGNLDDYYIDQGNLSGLVVSFIAVYLEIIDSAESKHQIKTNSVPSDPIEYEKFCAETLKNFGWFVELTKSTGDFGADIVAVNPQTGSILVVQCKFYSSSVGISAVQEVVGALRYYNAKTAIVVSPAEFTSAAKALANVNNIILCHHSQLPKPF